MNVLHPTLLAAGLAAVAVPILIHLLLRRKFRPVPWAAMRFVQIAHNKQRRRRRIEQLLLLVTRCLILAAIAFGVARPFFGDGQAAGETTLVLVIDDGLTASAVSADGSSSLDAHKAAALAEIDRLSAATGDRVAVFAMASPPRAVISPATSDFSAARRAIEAIAPADSAADADGAIALAREIAVEELVIGRMVVISDWREGSLAGAGGGEQPDPGPAAPEAPGRSAAPMDILLTPPSAAERPNLRIAGFAISRVTLLTDDTPAARQAVILIDRVGPSGGRASGEVGVMLLGTTNGDRSATRSVPFEIPPGTSSVSVSIELPPHSPDADGRDQAAVAIARLAAPPAVDAIASDSEARVALRYVERVTAGVVRARGLASDGIPAGAWIGAALRPSDQTPVRLRDLSPAGIDETSLIGLDLVAVARPDLLTPGSWTNLAAFADGGGTLLLFAPDTDGAATWTDELATRYGAGRFPSREAVDLDPPEGLESGDDDAVFSMLGSELDALASSVRVSRVLPIEIEPGLVSLRTDSGRPVLSRVAPSVWVFTVAASASWSDLPARPLFVPLMQEIARRSPARTVATTVTAGTPMPSGRGSLAGFGAVSLTPIETASGTTGSTRMEAGPPGRFAPRTAGGMAVALGDGPALGIVAINADARGGDTTPVEKEVAAARLGSTLDAGSYRWADGGSGVDGEGTIRGGDYAWLAFAAALLLAVLESAIAASAGRRGASPVRSAAS